MDVYEHFENGLSRGSWLNGARFRECFELDAPDELELELTSCLKDPFHETRLAIARLSSSSNHLAASKSAPPTPALLDHSFPWHAQSSSDSGSYSPTAFLPKLVRRISAASRATSTPPQNRLKKRGRPSSSAAEPLSPTRSLLYLAPTRSREGSSSSPRSHQTQENTLLQRSQTADTRLTNIPAAQFSLGPPPSRPANKRSFSAPLLDLVAKRTSRSPNHDIGKENIDPNLPVEESRRSFEVISRRPVVSNRSTNTGLTGIDELPSDLTLFAKRHNSDMKIEAACSPARGPAWRPRTNSTPSVMEIFPRQNFGLTTPIKQGDRLRRHSVATPALSQSDSDANSSPSHSPTRRLRLSTALLPLAASVPSLLTGVSSEDEASLYTAADSEREMVIGNRKERCSVPPEVIVIGEDLDRLDLNDINVFA